MLRRPPRSTRTDTLFPYTTLFRSLLRLLAQPLAVSISVVLIALLLERLLRLFNLVAASGSALGAVLLMIANLVPHYLGLALPAAFFASIFMLYAKLGDDNRSEQSRVGKECVSPYRSRGSPYT